MYNKINELKFRTREISVGRLTRYNFFVVFFGFYIKKYYYWAKKFFCISSPVGATSVAKRSEKKRFLLIKSQKKVSFF